MNEMESRMGSSNRNQSKEELRCGVVRARFVLVLDFYKKGLPKPQRDRL